MCDYQAIFRSMIVDILENLPNALRRPLNIVAVMCAVGATPGCAPGDTTIELKLSHQAAPQSLIALSTEEFARAANERLGERAKVVVFGSGQLGGDEASMQKLKLGTVSMTLVSTVMSSVVDQFALFDMPYLVEDRAHMRRIEEEIFWPDLAPRTENEGYRVIALWEHGFRHVTNNRRPIVTPSDLEGIKLRTPRSIWRMKQFQAYGASPSPLPFSELFLALQTGLMDGQENPLSNIATAKLYEVQDYLSLTGHVYSPAFLIVGADHWSQLPKDVREILEQTARETLPFVLRTAEQLEEEFLAQLVDGGMQVNQVDREQFVEASRSVYEEFGATVTDGRRLVDAALALANQ